MSSELIKFFGGSAMFLAAVAWLVRSLITHRLNKDIDNFKTKLEHESRAQLQRLSILNEKRAEIIEGLYHRIDTFVKSAASFASYIEFSSEPSKDEKAEIYSEAAMDFYEYFHKNKIYFSVDVCSKVEEIFNETRDALFDYGYYRRREDGRRHDHMKEHEAWTKAWDKIKDDIPPIREEIEMEFRKLLGVDD